MNKPTWVLIISLFLVISGILAGGAAMIPRSVYVTAILILSGVLLPIYSLFASDKKTTQGFVVGMLSFLWLMLWGFLIGTSLWFFAQRGWHI